MQFIHLKLAQLGLPTWSTELRLHMTKLDPWSGNQIPRASTKGSYVATKGSACHNEQQRPWALQLKPSTAKSISQYIFYIYIKMCAINWFLIYSQNCANIITVNLETSHLLKVTLYPLTAPHSLPISSSLKQPLIYCLHGLPIRDFHVNGIT